MQHPVLTDALLVLQILPWAAHLRIVNGLALAYLSKSISQADCTSLVEL